MESLIPIPLRYVSARPSRDEYCDLPPMRPAKSQKKGSWHYQRIFPRQTRGTVTPPQVAPIPSGSISRAEPIVPIDIGVRRVYFGRADQGRRTATVMLAPRQPRRAELRRSSGRRGASHDNEGCASWRDSGRGPIDPRPWPNAPLNKMCYQRRSSQFSLSVWTAPDLSLVSVDRSRQSSDWLHKGFQPVAGREWAEPAQRAGRTS